MFVQTAFHCHFLVGYDVADWLKAVRAMEILGILLVASAAVCGLLKLFAMTDQIALLLVAFGLNVTAGESLLQSNLS